jgi:hypothetical protein
VKKIDLGRVLDNLIKNLEDSNTDSEHEVFCYLKLFEQLDIVGKQQLFPLLENAMRRLMVVDSAKWCEYVPIPTDFIQSPESELYRLFETQTETALDYLVESFSENHLWQPKWSWGQFDKEWETARMQWVGVIAVKNMRILKNFNRTEFP